MARPRTSTRANQAVTTRLPCALTIAFLIRFADIVVVVAVLHACALNRRVVSSDVYLTNAQQHNNQATKVHARFANTSAVHVSGVQHHVHVCMYVCMCLSLLLSRLSETYWICAPPHRI